ncbi:putative beclin 1-associated autophagy-related key regulator-like protein, partial [Operophtera brumata]
MEFIGSDTDEEPPKRPQLHIVTPWINTDADFSHIQAWSKEAALSASPACTVWRRNGAGLALAAQLLTLLAWVLDTRLPHALSL